MDLVLAPPFKNCLEAIKVNQDPCCASGPFMPVPSGNLRSFRPQKMPATTGHLSKPLFQTKQTHQPLGMSYQPGQRSFHRSRGLGLPRDSSHSKASDRATRPMVLVAVRHVRGCPGITFGVPKFSTPNDAPSVRMQNSVGMTTGSLSPPVP